MVERVDKGLVRGAVESSSVVKGRRDGDGSPVGRDRPKVGFSHAPNKRRYRCEVP